MWTRWLLEGWEDEVCVAGERAEIPNGFAMRATRRLRESCMTRDKIQKEMREERRLG